MMMSQAAPRPRPADEPVFSTSGSRKEDARRLTVLLYGSMFLSAAAGLVLFFLLLVLHAPAALVLLALVAAVSSVLVMGAQVASQRKRLRPDLDSVVEEGSIADRMDGED